MVPEKAHWNIQNSNSSRIPAQFRIPVPIPVLGDWNKNRKVQLRTGGDEPRSSV